MKKFLIIFSILSCFFVSCARDSILNYKESVVICKFSDNYFKRYLVTIRIKNTDGTYYFKDVSVPKYEFDEVELGDTIK